MVHAIHCFRHAIGSIRVVTVGRYQLTGFLLFKRKQVFTKYQFALSISIVVMSPKHLFVTVFGFIMISTVHSANILAIFTCISPSHLIVEISMAKVLAENGHNVTVVTTLKPHVSHKNLNIIYLPLTEEELKLWNENMADMATYNSSSTTTSIFRIRDQMLFMFKINLKAMHDPRVTDLYENKDNKFDLVMIGYSVNNFQMGIAKKLKDR